MDVKTILKAVIVICIVVFAFFQLKDFIKNKEKITVKQGIWYYGIGLIVNFFDTLGIGSFAPTLALYHITGTVDDKEIPGTLNVGVSIVVFVESLLFINEVDVNATVLISSQITAIIGAFFGAKANEKINVKALRLIMGTGLLVATLLLIGSKFGVLPSGGTAMEVHGIKLIIIDACTFLFGFLLPLGIGHYAPTMAVIYLTGMAPIAAFPIMMTMGGFCTATGGFRFFKNGLFHRHAAMGQTLAGVIGVVIAFYLVKSLPLNVLQWLVIIVVGYSALTMIHQSLKKERTVNSDEPCPENSCC